MSHKFISAFVYDLDGVLSDTSLIHRKAWLSSINQFEKSKEFRESQMFNEVDYEELLSGRSRSSGLKNVSVARNWPQLDGQELKEILETKNKYFLGHLTSLNPSTLIYQDANAFLSQQLNSGVTSAVCSSSKNAKLVLARAGIFDHFEAIVDGLYIEEKRLASKPSPEPFSKCIELLGVTPQEVAIFEDAEAGLEGALRAEVNTVAFLNRTGVSEKKIKAISLEYKGKNTKLLIVNGFQELVFREGVLCVA